MSVNGGQAKQIEDTIKKLADAGAIIDEWEAVDYFCRERKRIMRRQRARRKSRRGWA